MTTFQIIALLFAVFVILTLGMCKAAAPQAPEEEQYEDEEQMEYLTDWQAHQINKHD